MRKVLTAFFTSLISVFLFLGGFLGFGYSLALTVESSKQSDVLGVDIVSSDVDVLDLEILSMEAPKINSGDSVKVYLDIENKANTPLALDRVELEVMDLNEVPLESLSDITLSKIEPSTTKKIQAEFESNLEKGQYRIDATAIFMGERVFSKKMILKVNAKPAKAKEDNVVKEIEEIRAQIFGRRSGLILVISGLLTSVIVLIYYFKTGKTFESKLEKKLIRSLREYKIMTWMIIAVATLVMAFGFYLYITSSL
ncbi:hypothetical protein JXA63_03025 [Candidatus Woesebacteria bacterium]|nr:hypothetical protein [Candidatus Woesebacteria bacterium]